MSTAILHIVTFCVGIPHPHSSLLWDFHCIRHSLYHGPKLEKIHESPSITLALKPRGNVTSFAEVNVTKPFMKYQVFKTYKKYFRL